MEAARTPRWRLAVGGWRLEAGGWRLEGVGWGPEAGGRMEAGTRRLEINIGEQNGATPWRFPTYFQPSDLEQKVCVSKCVQNR